MKNQSFVILDLNTTTIMYSFVTVVFPFLHTHGTSNHKGHIKNFNSAKIIF